MQVGHAAGHVQGHLEHLIAISIIWGRHKITFDVQFLTYAECMHIQGHLQQLRAYTEAGRTHLMRLRVPALHVHLLVQ